MAKKIHITQYNNSLTIKMIVFFVLLFAMAMMTISVISYSIFNHALETRGEMLLKNSVVQALDSIQYQHELYEFGLKTEEEAQESVKQSLIGKMNVNGKREAHGEVDLGDNGYFIIYDLTGTEVLHPILEGENLWNATSLDDENQLVVQEQIEKALGGGGYVNYAWTYPFKDKEGQKISYSAYDTHWNWVVSASIYKSDFSGLTQGTLLVIVLALLVVTSLVTVLVYWYIRRVTQPITDIATAMQEVEKGHFDPVVPVSSSDALNQLAYGYNNMLYSIQKANDNLEEKNQRLQYLVFHDELTEMTNRYGFKIAVEKSIASGLEKANLIQLDVGGFKAINSTFGYDTGDVLLQNVAHFLMDYTIVDMVAARTSDNEFALWIPTLEDYEVLEHIRQIKKGINNKSVKGDINQMIDLHVAVVKYPEQGGYFESLYRKAAMAMKYAKEVKNFKPHIYESDMEESHRSEMQMRNHLSRGLERKELKAHYQAKVNYKTGETVGVEALARWRSEELGDVSPGQFVPAVNRFFLDKVFGEYMIHQVFSDFPRLKVKYGKKIKISINISPVYFISEGFTEFVEEQLSVYKVPGKQVIFEITEDLFISDFTGIDPVIHALNELGISLSLDDFGTGYSSLNYLKNIKADELKIDRSFIQTIVEDHQSVELLNVLCNVAEVYGYNIVAEGVETKEQLEMIKNTPIEVIQGYLFSRPEPL